MPDRSVPSVVGVRLVESVARQPDLLVLDDGRRQRRLAEAAGLAAGVAGAVRAGDPGGVAPVPVLVDRGVDALVGMLGVHLAGRAFAAIDVAEPVARQLDMVRRLGAAVGVDATTRGGARGAAVAREGLGLRWIEVATVAPAELTVPEIDPDGLAAVVFTSGSTGRPKGVRLDHATLTAKVERADLQLASHPGPAPVLSPLAFVTGLTHLGEVAVGRPLRLRDPQALGPHGLLQWLHDEGFTSVGLVPSFARAVLEGDGPVLVLDQVTKVQTYGEGLDWTDVPALRRLAPAAVIDALFGATEAGGAVTSFLIAPGTPLGRGTVPLGAPLPGRAFRLEPLAGEGDGPLELVVEGPVASGYWDDPDLDEARFGRTPEGTRCWRSGDLVAELDGELVHRGRADDLVKVGGRLVEPAEAEAALRALPEIAQAVVLPQPLGGNARLVGHVVTASADADPDPAAVRAALRQVLPDALLPTVLVRHDALPLGPRGKVDRAQLTARPVVPWVSARHTEPETDLEVLVAEAVHRIVGLPPEVAIGRHDDLFAAGLDSLGAVELLVELDDRGVGGLGPGDLLEHRTPAALAARVGAPVARTGPVVLNADGAGPPVWVVAGAGGTALAFHDLATALGPDRPVVVFEAPGLHDGAPPVRSVRAAARRHLRQLDRLRATTFVASRDTPVALVGHSHGGLVAAEVAHLLDRRGTPCTLVVLDTALASHRVAARVRARLGDLRRARWGRPASPSARRRPRPSPGPPRPRPERTGDAAPHAAPGVDPLGQWDRLDQVRRRRTLLDLVAGRPALALLAAPGRDGGHPAWRYAAARLDGLEQARRHRVRPLGVPVLIVEAEPAGIAAAWCPLAPGAEVARVAAGHTDMLRPPAVAGLARQLEGFWARAAPGSAHKVGGGGATLPAP